MARKKPKGWVKEPFRHGQSARGIKTAIKHIKEARSTRGYDNINEELRAAQNALEDVLEHGDTPHVPLRVPEGDAPSSVVAAALGRLKPSTNHVGGRLESATDAIRAFEGSGDAEDLEAAVDFMDEAEDLSNSFTEVQTILGARELLMREYLRVSDEDLMEDAIESMYVTGYTDIAHDVERGNLSKALQDISREIMRVEDSHEASTVSGQDDIKRMRAARKALKALG